MQILLGYEIINYLIYSAIGIFVLWILNKLIFKKLSLAFKLAINLTPFTFLFFLIIANNYQNLLEVNNYQAYLFLGFVTITYLMLIYVVLLILLEPINKLINSTKRLAKGYKDAGEKIEGSKEFDIIDTNINLIEKQYKKSSKTRLEMEEEYFKFIPKQFFKYLGKKDVLEMKLGANVQKTVSILFCDMRDSFSRSETISLYENFELINEYLGLIGQVVTRNNGFIDKYLGDGVLAVFARSRDAIKASSQIAAKLNKKTVKKYNLKKFNFGIGIHTGKVVIGIVGGENRMSPTVISDSVNLASRVETLNKEFETKILFTKQTLNNLPNNFSFSYRYIGTFKVKGNLEKLPLFENLDYYSKESKDKIMKYSDIFESAIRAYEKGQNKKASKIFNAIVKENPKDEAAKKYLKISERKQKK